MYFAHLLCCPAGCSVGLPTTVCCFGCGFSTKTAVDLLQESFTFVQRRLFFCNNLIVLIYLHFPTFVSKRTVMDAAIVRSHVIIKRKCIYAYYLLLAYSYAARLSKMIYRILMINGCHVTVDTLRERSMFGGVW